MKMKRKRENTLTEVIMTLSRLLSFWLIVVAPNIESESSSRFVPTTCTNFNKIAFIPTNICRISTAEATQNALSRLCFFISVKLELSES